MPTDSAATIQVIPGKELDPKIRGSRKGFLLIFLLVAVLGGYLYIVGGEISQFIDGKDDPLISRAGQSNGETPMFRCACGMVIAQDVLT